jgi:hypothetical protein
MIGQLGDGPEIASVRDQIYQLYLRSLPDLSARKHFIHRKKTPGFGKDALRAFAVKGYHDAYQYARIKHAFDLRRTMEALSEDIKTATSKPAQKALAHQEKRLRAFQEEVLEAGLTTKEVKQRAAELNQAMETMQDARGDKALSAGEKFLVAEAAQWKQFAEWMRDWAKYGGLPDWIQQQIKDIEVRFDTLRRINRKKRGYEQATNYHGELQAAYAHLMNPSSGRWANLLNQYGYLGHLALSPAAWITNATQTPLITIPYVAARYGSTQTYAAFGKAMQEALRGAVGGQKEQALGIREALTRPDEIEAHTAGLERGIIQHGRAMDLAGLAEEGASRSGWHRKFALAMTFGFHHAELLNREVSFMASYRLARDAGVSPSEAIDYAAKVVNDTHFNYSAENRPRFLRGDLMRVLGQFKLYSQSLTYLVWRNVHQSLSKDATPEERREARRFLLHMSAMQMAAAGAMGLPIGVLAAYGVGAGAIKAAERAGWKGALAYTAMVIGAAVGLGGDDPDDPKAWESEFRQIMNDWLGAKGGEAVSRGLVNTLVGIDLSTRVSQSELWWRSLDADLSDKAWWGEVLSQVAGPSIGTIATLVQGMQMAAEGHVWRGIEKAVPKAVKDPMQALRFALEGAQTLKGDPLIETFTPWEIAAKASGFQPSRLSERYQENSAEKDREHKIEDRRKDLTRIVVEARESTAKALNAGEASQRKAAEADFEAAIRDVERFNTKNPRYAITGPSILRSAQSRASARQKAQHGIFVNPKIPRRYDFAGDEAQD